MKNKCRKKRRIIAFLIVCIITLCAFECTPEQMAQFSGLLQGVGIGMLGSSNENVQLGGFVTYAIGWGIDQIRPPVNFDPGIRNSWAEIGFAVTNPIVGRAEEANQILIEDTNVVQSAPEVQPAPTAFFITEENALPRGSSSITSPPVEQNTANPQVNPVVSTDLIAMPSRNPGGRGAGTGAQRVGGNVTYRPASRQLTRRDDISANPRAAETTESRAQGVPAYITQRQQPLTGRFDESVNPAIGQNTQQPTPLAPVQIARAAAPPPEVIARTIAEHTPQRQQLPLVVSPPPAPPSPQPPAERPDSIPMPDFQASQNSFIVQGIDWGDPEANVSPNFKVGHVFTSGVHPSGRPDAFRFDQRRRDALFELELNEIERIISNIIRMAGILEGLKERYGRILITSWYRDTIANNLVGGVSDSRHLHGDGVDIFPLDMYGGLLQQALNPKSNWPYALGRSWGVLNRRGNPNRFIHIDSRENHRFDY